MQREIGASTVRGRDTEIKFTFAQYMFRTRNGLLEGILRKMVDEIKPKRWTINVNCGIHGGVINKSFTPEDYDRVGRK